MARVVDLGALVYYKHRTGLGNIQMGTEMSGIKTRYMSSSAISITCTLKARLSNNCRWFSILSNKTMFATWTERRTNNNVLIKTKQYVVVISLL